MIYWDNNATTPMLPEVRDAMLPFLGEFFANPSSPYSASRSTSRAIGAARNQLAGLLDSDPSNLFFTSGGTESNNLAFHLAAEARPDKRHIITASTEHASVLACADRLEESGYSVTVLPVDPNGRIDLSELETSLTADTLMISLMAANNETGVLHPVEDFAELARSRGVYFHCDGIQAAGKVPVSLRSLQPDFYSISGHKFHGPKGSGALYISSRIPAGAMIHGGDQELGRRAGTENVAAIVGLGTAAEIAGSSINETATHTVKILNIIEDKIKRALPAARFIAETVLKLPNTRLFVHPGIEAESVIALLDECGVCVSSGSACASGSQEPSHVLKAMGVPDSELRSAVRLSVSRLNTGKEADIVGSKLIEVMHRLAALNP